MHQIITGDYLEHVNVTVPSIDEHGYTRLTNAASTEHNIPDIASQGEQNSTYYEIIGPQNSPTANRNGRDNSATNERPGDRMLASLHSRGGPPQTTLTEGSTAPRLPPTREGNQSDASRETVRFICNTLSYYYYYARKVYKK